MPAERSKKVKYVPVDVAHSLRQAKEIVKAYTGGKIRKNPKGNAYAFDILVKENSW